MKRKIIIGSRSFKYKKDALNFYKKILNSYILGEELSLNDRIEIFELLKFKNKYNKNIIGVKVDKVRYNTKCFYLIKDDLSLEVFSYIKSINGDYSPKTKFSRTCRDLVQDDLRNVKLTYFKKNSKKGQVKCQETKELCFWEELVIDHRQPNTFSMIVDRFIEVYNIDINIIEYIKIMDGVYEFRDELIANNFKEYHKIKANLRIVKKIKNSERSYLARVKQQKMDLKIE